MVFTSLTESRACLASASVAQVHSAELHSGEKVVVKVIRPEVEAVIRQDLQLVEALQCNPLWIPIVTSSCLGQVDFGNNGISGLGNGTEGCRALINEETG